jgi:hypothetical protein
MSGVNCQVQEVTLGALVHLCPTSGIGASPSGHLLCTQNQGTHCLCQQNLTRVLQQQTPSQSWNCQFGYHSHWQDNRPGL